MPGVVGTIVTSRLLRDMITLYLHTDIVEKKTALSYLSIAKCQITNELASGEKVTGMPKNETSNFSAFGPDIPKISPTAVVGILPQKSVSFL